MKRAARTHLAEARKRRQWTQQEVADLLGTTQHNVSRWERGETTPGSYFRAKLCTLFGASAQALGLVLDQGSDEQPAAQPTLHAADNLHSLWLLPYPRNPHFTGRDDLLEQLDQYLSPRRSDDSTATQCAALTQPQAIKGLGGIGKTQIAVEYAYRAREQERYTHTLWINAASEEAIMTSFVTLAELLPTFPAKDETDQRKLVAAVIRWLEQCSQPWLLIFDNADDLSLVQESLPHQGQGSILLTTRANAVGSLATPVEVDTMSFLEGTQLLLSRAQRLADASEDEINEAGNIVVALDHFPLAIDQAGAYIEETGCSCSDYLRLYQDHRQALLARRGTQATNYPDSVATTWSLSFQKIEQTNPAAADLLRLCAFLAPDHIPEELLKDGAPFWPPILQRATADPLAFDHLLAGLLTFSLVKRVAASRTLSLHRLVQAVQVDALDSEEQRQWAERVVRAVNAAFPPHPKDDVAAWPQCLRYLEQAQACDTLIQQHRLLLPEAADLLDRTGTYLRRHASYTLAAPLYQRSLAIREQGVEREQLRVAASLEELAILYRTQGNYAEAEPLFQRALAIYEQHGSPDPSRLAALLNGLGHVYMDLGKYVQAEPLYQRALRLWEQQVGPEHPQVANALYSLANLCRARGKYAEAEPLYQRLLRLCEEQLDPEHPYVALTLNGLANLYNEQGRYAEAEPLYQRAMRLWEQQVGQEHPLFATALTNLALLYVALEQYTEAEPLLQRARHIKEQLLGPDHLDVAHALNGLADLYRGQHKYSEAERLYQRVLAIRERTLEPHHHDLAETLHGFAALREAQGNLQEAVLLYHRTLEICERVFEAEHPKTVETRTRYRELLREMGRATTTTPREMTGPN